MSIELDELQRWKRQLEAEKAELDRITQKDREEIERLKIRCSLLENAVWSWRVTDPDAADSFANTASELRGAIHRKEAELQMKNREVKSRLHEMDRLVSTINERISQL